jgi:hypothetical protein
MLFYEIFVLDFSMESLAPEQDSPSITNKNGGLMPFEYGDTVLELIKDRNFNNFLSFSNTIRKKCVLHLGHAKHIPMMASYLENVQCCCRLKMIQI